MGLDTCVDTVDSEHMESKEATQTQGEYEVGQNVRFKSGNGYIYAVITRIKNKPNGMHLDITHKDGTRGKFFIPTDKSVLENLCEICGGEGVIEYDDDYNGSGELVAEGKAVKCLCQLEDGENEE